MFGRRRVRFDEQIRHYARMPSFQGLQVDATDGERWELALSLLETGEGPVRAGDVILRRATAGPAADGRIHVEVLCSTDPDSLTATLAETEFRQGLDQVDAMAAADVRLATLIARCGVVRQYVWNYGMGSSLLATVGNDDTVDWDWEPSARA
jgi:hypothetical protein